MRYVFLILASVLLLPNPAFAADLAGLQASMDTVWLITAGALVFFMQAGFALVEGGMVRAKNSVNVIMKNYVDACFGAIAFWMVGYGLMFGDNFSGWFGESHYLLGNAAHLDYSLLFFQTMFAATAATIASGALAERIEYKAYLVGSVVVTAFIYPVFGSWAWGSLYHGSGWLKQMGFVDFAGSTVVHSIGGWVALAGIIVLGPRLGKFGSEGEIRTIRGHNLPMVALGGFILWLGWFGFNGGSTAAANTSIGLINLNTHLSGAAGAVGAMLGMVLLRQPILLTNTVNGSIAGLVAITAGCATMEPMFAIATGAIAGILMILMAMLLEQLHLDDVVGAVSVHAFGGAWGTLAAGLFYAGDMFNADRIYVQLLGIGAAFLWAMPVSLLMYFLIGKVMGLRASTMNEQRGLDFTEHDEIGYPEFQKDIVHQTQGGH
ncbi:ammonium transporter [Sulfuriferula sp. AH1]|uniref:ammonium transporter n=1 Tax=Sulfuriferula sp. AH1 TaxID=1985873 RepID=UPI000B3B4FE9|nr:ammonium transporter [Sulfuriferula sp. AH1]ARU30588.1 ammonium transporter [Sulfuriferula sp. AH1]